MATLQTAPPVVAFLGLGAMGFAMSTHLLKQGISVVGYDVWKPTLDKFQTACKTITHAQGTAATSPAEAVKTASIVLLMVANHHHVHSALFDADNSAIRAIPRNATVIICSTIPPTQPQTIRDRLDTDFARQDIKLIDAPVSGGVVGSASGTLTIMASSNDPSLFTNPSINLVLSHLSDHGKKLYVIPGTLGGGTSAKALNQVMCGTHIVGASEIMALAAINGLDTRRFYETMKSVDLSYAKDDINSINGGSSSGHRRYGWTWMFENRGPRMLDASLPVASATSIIMKDVGIIKDEETRLNITLPQLNNVHATLRTCMDSGLAALDDALVSQWYLGGLESDRRDLAMRLAGIDTSTGGGSTSTSTEASNGPIPTLSSSSAPSDQTQTAIMTETLLFAHALINFVSAYETVLFAEALDLMGPQQRQTWFAIISGAAGASRVFGEVIPLAFAADADGENNNNKTVGNWRAGFKSYAKTVFSSSSDRSLFKSGESAVETTAGPTLDAVEKLIADAKTKDVNPLLVETALAFVRNQLSS